MIYHKIKRGKLSKSHLNEVLCVKSLIYPPLWAHLSARAQPAAAICNYRRRIVTRLNWCPIDMCWISIWWGFIMKPIDERPGLVCIGGVTIVDGKKLWSVYKPKIIKEINCLFPYQIYCTSCAYSIRKYMYVPIYFYLAFLG